MTGWNTRCCGHTRDDIASADTAFEHESRQPDHRGSVAGHRLWEFHSLRPTSNCCAQPARARHRGPHTRYFKPLRQVIESINNTLKTQLDLERHGGRTIAGVASRVLQRILALTTAIWHNDQTNQPTLRSLTAYDH